MKWKFWKKDNNSKDETTIQINNVVSTGGTAYDNTIYVRCQTSEKALDLYNKLKKEREKK